MGCKHMENEEKAYLLVWKQEKCLLRKYVTVQAGKKSTVMLQMATMCNSPPNVVPSAKSYLGCSKISKATDKVLARELCKNPHLTASKVKEIHPNLLKDTSNTTFRKISSCPSAMLCSIFYWQSVWRKPEWISLKISTGQLKNGGR